MAATLTPLREEVHRVQGPPTVDRERGIIRGVKVAGVRSSNRGRSDGQHYAGRIYPLSVLTRAAPLYEGKPVYLDHPGEHNDQRSAADKLGKLINVRAGSDGLYADLVLVRSHPMAERILEAASDPDRHDLYGFSHNADGETEVRNGRLVVKEICEVRSVDLVADPATTTGLFESRTPGRVSSASGRRYPMKLREWFAAIKLLPPVRRTLRHLMEAGYMDPDMPMGEADMPMDMEPETAAPAADDPATMDPAEALRAGFRAAFAAIFDDTTLDVKAKVARAKQLITTAEELLASGEEIPEEDTSSKEDEPVEESADQDADDRDDGKDLTEECDEEKETMKESKELALLRAEKAVRRLCESVDYRPSEDEVEALAHLPNDQKRKALIEKLRKSSASKTATPDESRHKARSAPDWLPESAGRRSADPVDEIKDGESFARALLGGLN